MENESGNTHGIRPCPVSRKQRVCHQYNKFEKHNDRQYCNLYNGFVKI
jgi:hypothetical protein